MQTKLLLSLLAAFALVGCATTKEPVITTVIQKVEVPISVPCKVEMPPPRDYNFNKITAEMDIFEKVQALLADRRLHLGYEAELKATLGTCTAETVAK
jgi:hypothetical protein